MRSSRRREYEADDCDTSQKDVSSGRARYREAGSASDGAPGGGGGGRSRSESASVALPAVLPYNLGSRSKFNSSITLFDAYVQKRFQTKALYSTDLRGTTSKTRSRTEVIVKGELIATGYASHGKASKIAAAQMALRHYEPTWQPPEAVKEAETLVPNASVSSASSGGASLTLEQYRAISVLDRTERLLITEKALGDPYHKSPLSALRELHSKNYHHLALDITKTSVLVDVKTGEREHTGIVKFGQALVTAVGTPKYCQHHAAQKLLAKMFPQLRTWREICLVVRRFKTDYQTKCVDPENLASDDPDKLCQFKRDAWKLVTHSEYEHFKSGAMERKRENAPFWTYDNEDTVSALYDRLQWQREQERREGAQRAGAHQQISGSTSLDADEKKEKEEGERIVVKESESSRRKPCDLSGVGQPCSSSPKPWPKVKAEPLEKDDAFDNPYRFRY